ncbi:MAG: hypothetical protein JW726_00910 [Anaerolineales bacterium]|nr:hypothetical protein [Anaerolineales bacterium]
MPLVPAQHVAPRKSPPTVIPPRLPRTTTPGSAASSQSPRNPDPGRQTQAGRERPLAMTLAKSRNTQTPAQSRSETADLTQSSPLEPVAPPNSSIQMIQRVETEVEETGQKEINLNSLAQGILPIIRRMLEIERERRPF